MKGFGENSKEKVSEIAKNIQNIFSQLSKEIEKSL